MPKPTARRAAEAAVRKKKSGTAHWSPFPTKHPLVKNKDGTHSNVRTATFEMNGKHYVIPTMVEGKQLSGKEAVAIAKKQGLSKYPSYKTAKEALRASKRLHGQQKTPRQQAAERMLKRKKK